MLDRNDTESPLFSGHTLLADVQLADTLLERVSNEAPWKHDADTATALVRLSLVSGCLLEGESSWLTMLAALNVCKGQWESLIARNKQTRQAMMFECKRVVSNIYTAMALYQQNELYLQTHAVRDLLTYIGNREHPDKGYAEFRSALKKLLSIGSIMFIPDHVIVERLNRALDWSRQNGARDRLFGKDDQYVEARVEEVMEAVDAIELVVMNYALPKLR